MPCAGAHMVLWYVPKRTVTGTWHEDLLAAQAVYGVCEKYMYNKMPALSIVKWIIEFCLQSDNEAFH